MSNALTRSLGAFLICTTSSVLLFSCNSKQEKVTRPIDPEVPALYAETEHTEDERKEIMQDAVADLRAADAEADLELERIKARAAQRKLEKERLAQEAQKTTTEEARKQLKGKKYHTLTLPNGKSFNDVTIMEATDIGITISYEHGARRIKYPDLPVELQRLCHYDEKSSDIAVAKEEKLRRQQEAHLAKIKQQKSLKKNISKSKDIRKSNATTSKKDEIPSSGSGKLTVSIKSTYSRYITGMGKVHFKKLRVRAIANIKAKVYNGSRYVGSLNANETKEFFVESGYHGKYDLILKDSKGNVLDKESHNRKSGLGGSRGL